MTAADAVNLARDVGATEGRRRALKPVQGALAILRELARRERAECEKLNWNVSDPDLAIHQFS